MATIRPRVTGNEQEGILGPEQHTHNSYGSLGSPRSNRMPVNEPLFVNTHGSSSRTQEQYEEFFNGTVVCPSCLGSGRIPRESEHLLALISVKDKRLQPRRTGIYVALAVSICVAIAVLLLFFLYPRNVTLHSNEPTLQPSLLVINDTEKILQMRVTNIYNVSNSNFYSVKVKQLSAMVFFDLKLVGETKNTTLVTIPLRGHAQVHLSFNISMPKEDGYISKYCASPGKHSLLMPFETMLQTSYLGRTYQDSLDTYQHVICSKPSSGY